MSWSIPSHRFDDAHLEQLTATQDVLVRLGRAFSLSALAEILNVDKSTLSRYLAGKRAVPSDISARAIDLEYVLTRAARVMLPSVIAQWLVGYDPGIGGRPIDALAMQGVAPVIDAIERIRTLTYA